MAAMRALCWTCGENNGQVTCEGCSKRFCLTHFDDHRRELGTQFDEIEVARNVFRETLTEKIAQPRSHTLIQQIDVWENESISRIRQVAQDTRQLLLNHIAELNSKLEEKLRQLTDQLQQSRKKNEFSERDLDEWREELARMKNELTQPPNVKIQDDATPLIMKINVDVADVRNKQKLSGTRHAVDNKTTKTGEKRVLCSFCDEECASSAIGEHLMLCGNKTYQCPYCEKYIRRAVFAYHFENNCTDLDVSEGDVRRDANKPDNSSIFLPTISETRIGSSRQPDTDRLYDVNQLDDIANIPCEMCDELIESRHYIKHSELCIKREEKRMQNQPISIDQANQIFYLRCRHCNEERTIITLTLHETICFKNPRRVTMEAHFKQMFRMPYKQT